MEAINGMFPIYNFLCQDKHKLLEKEEKEILVWEIFCMSSDGFHVRADNEKCANKNSKQIQI